MITANLVKNFKYNNHPIGRKRGFIIPIEGETLDGSVLIVSSTKNDYNHEQIAREFLYMTKEQLREMISMQGSSLERAMELYTKFEEGYKNFEKKYHNSTKDYLIYEVGALAWDDQKNGRSILFRSEDKNFDIDRRIERVIYEYRLNGWSQIEVNPEKINGQFGE